MPIHRGSDFDSTPDLPGQTEVGETEAGAAAADGPARIERPRFLGDYRILREIGRGGMGVVYEAWQVSLSRRVALKVLSHGLGDARRRRRFEREARSAGRLHHTNIVPVFGFGEFEGIPYYVMQCIRGVGLDALLDETRSDSERPDPTEPATESDASDAAPPYHAAEAEPTTIRIPAENDGDRDADADPEGDGRAASANSAARPNGGPDRWKWVARLGAQAASGLDYAHSQGILHRDVKPSNLLLDERGTLWLTDFGLAKLTDHHDLTQSGDFVGTLRYMPPEAFEGVHGRAGDVYGLGLTLYELLARRPAFDEEDRARLMWRVSRESPTPLRQLDRRIPRDLATIVQKAIERRPEDRYATAAEMGADLSRFLEDRPVLARRASPLERYWRWAKRNPAIAVLGAILTAVLVLATIGSLLAAGRFRDQARFQQLLADSARRARDKESGARRTAQHALQALEAAREDEDRTLHDTRASLAGAAWAADDYGQYRALMDLMRPAPGETDRRGWEWRYLLGLDSEAELEVVVPDESFAAVAMRPDGAEFATLSVTGTMRIRRTADGGERLVIRAPNVENRRSDLRSGVQALAYSPDGRRLAGAGGDGAIGIHDAETGTRTQLLKEEGDVAVLALDWSPDGKRLASGLASHAARIWDVESAALVAVLNEPHDGPVTGVAFAPDGKTLATSGYEGVVRIWSLDPAPAVTHALRGHQGEVRAATYSPDGSRLASAGLDGTIRLWDVAVGKPVGVIAAHDGGVICLNWSRQGWLASGGNDNAVRIWDPAVGRSLHKFLGHSSGVRALSAGREGGLVVSVSPDGMAKVWDARTPSRPRALQAPASSPFGGAVAAVAMTADGRLVASGHYDGTARVWDAATGAFLRQFGTPDSGVRALAFSPDGHRLFVTSGETNPPHGDAVVWNLDDGRGIVNYREHREVVDAVAFLDDHRVATAGGDFRIHVWNPDTAEQLMTLEGHSEAVRRLAVSRGGGTIASGADDGTVRLWDAETGRAGLVMAAGSRILDLAFSDDGRWIAAAIQGGSILLWDQTRPALPPQRLDGHSHDALALAFTPDGRLVSGGFDKSIRVWDVEGRRSLLTLRGHGAGVTGLAISRDGSRLASGSLDHSVKLWDAPVVPIGPPQSASAR